MRPEYRRSDFSALVRGKYTARIADDGNEIVQEPEAKGQHVPARDRRAELVGLLQSWMDDGDVQEQQETGEFLVKALDEDRLSDRPLFPSRSKT